ncbi:MAG: DbpA RNA binding domain-containing protein [Spirochaetia bacterium]|nr:DbpA RNA binding domain-containing protein [Spirochaetia bacterium]
MVRLFIGVGKEDHVRPGDLVGAIAGESDIPGKSIGAIQLLDRHSFVDVKKDDVSKVLDRMKEVKIKGRRTNIRLAKP